MVKKKSRMKTGAKISVIVTSYNNAGEIEKCLNSLLTQTLREIEIVCVDDRSTDGSREVLRKFEDRIKVIYRKKNGGSAAARNTGIENSSAPFLMFCDGDDFYEPEMCEKMFGAISQDGVDVAVSEIRVIYEAHKKMKVSDDLYYSLKFAGVQKLNDEKIFKTDLSAVNKIFRREILEKYKIRFPEGLKFEDAYFCVVYLCVSKKAFYLKEKLYNYVRRDGSIMSQTWSKKAKNDFAIDHLKIAFLIFDFLERTEKLAEKNALFWRFFEAFDRFAIENSKSLRRMNETKAVARDFVAEHQAEFMKIPAARQGRILRLNRRAVVNLTKIRRWVGRVLRELRGSMV